MSEAQIIYLPLPKLENVRNRAWLEEELERAEQRVEQIQRLLGIVGVKDAMQEGGDESA